MTNTRSSLRTYSGWLTLALVVIGLSFIGLRATATSFRLPSASQLTPSTELRNPLTVALDLLKPIQASSPAAFNSPLPSLMQQPAGCGASFAQAPGSPVNVGLGPESAAIGDFNLDGKPDLAVANAGSNSVTILLGNGSGGFTQPAGSPFSTGNHPSSVAVGDFNLDGKPDLAVSNIGSNNVTILLGNGSGGFIQAAGSPVTVGNSPASVSTGDFNLDGKTDLAVANVSSGNITVLLGNGSGGFTQAAGSPIGAFAAPLYVTVGDFNLDGKPDLASLNSNSNSVAILLGNGGGGFIQTPGTQISVGNSPRSMVVGDFNLDGKPDLAVVNSGPNNITILLGNGSGGLTQAAGSPVSTGTFPSSVTAGDFNLDGKPDLAVANFGSANVTILQGNGSGGFSNAAASPVSVGDRPVSVVVGDFNHDGKLDFATANNSSNNVTVQLNTCPTQPCTGIAFSQPTGSPISVGAYPGSITMGDFNLDGKLDIATTNYSSHNITVLLGNGVGGFTQAAGSPIHMIFASVVSTGDFNLDGKPDLAVASGEHMMIILLGNGAGNFAQFAGPSVGTLSIPSSIVVGDLNLDGKPDVAVANAAGDAVTILLGNGIGGFTEPTFPPMYVGDGPGSLAIADFNHDGKPDLAVANGLSNNVTIMLGNGNGSFMHAMGSPISTGHFASYFLTVGDFNLDSKPDLAVANYGSNNVTILLGNGIGGFTQPIGSTISAGELPISLAVGDFNLDSKPDIAVANQLPSSVTILLGNGAGLFTSANSLISAGSYPRRLLVNDLNLDNKPDIVIVNEVSSNLTIQLNSCTPNTQPSITCPSNIILGSNANQNSASVSFNITATGIPTPTVTCRVGNTVITSPHVFPVGTTTVNCTASNGVAPDASCSFTVTVNRVSGTANDPLACTGPGSKVQATLNISNDGQVNQNVVSNTTFTNLIGVPGSCAVTPNVGTCTVTSGGLSYSATLAPGQTVAITYLTQVSDLAPPGAQVCTNNSVSFNGGAPLNFSACDVIDCPAVGPGGGFPAAAETSAQKAGSVLVYNIYTSSTDPNRQNTRVNITNSHSRLPAFVHMFFVAESCSIADSYVCLTANQTASFLASDLDPGVTGYIVALAVDARGCPIDFNYLLGDEYVKFVSGHAANLSALAFAALPGGLPLCDGSSVT
ncbi:MAG: FG-GAP-like repeat-containing protein, partial [Blastocatellia bacterium]